MFEIRTDLALEVSQTLEKKNQSHHGIEVSSEKFKENIIITKVAVTTKNGERQLKKPKGNYYTIETEFLPEEKEAGADISKAIACVLSRLIQKKEKTLQILVVGLGNREVTADALGPKVVDKIFVTRHLMQEFGAYILDIQNGFSVCGFAPGVMAQTGMESEEMIQAIARTMHADYIIVIDALAARNVKRLNRTIQITDTGIVPGSGVGNHRNAINRETIGCPVISIGIPTVVDAATIVCDSVEEWMEKEGEHLSFFNDVRENISPLLHALYVTSKDIDESIRFLSEILADGLNRFFYEE